MGADADADAEEDEADAADAPAAAGLDFNPARRHKTVTQASPRRRAAGRRACRPLLYMEVTGAEATPPIYTKKWNNWNACYSCGFDVPKWHTSATCPIECRKADHQEAYTRGKYKEYVAAGWSPIKAKMHKKICQSQEYGE